MVCYGVPMKCTTLGFLLREEHILLAMKKRGFGAGKWNGFGGKIEQGETPEESLARECAEEIGVHIEPKDAVHAADLTFRFLDQPDWDMFCRVYTLSSWEGEPHESEEMAPRWFLRNEIPFQEMWVDDPHWLPLVLAGQRIKAIFEFSHEGAEIVRHTIADMPNDPA